MKTKIWLNIGVAIAVLKGLCACSNQLPQLGKAPIKEVIEMMTLEEKARIVVGTAKACPLPPQPAPAAFKRKVSPADYNTFQTKMKVCGAAGDSYAISHLGIPSIIYADGPAGVRIDPNRENDEKRYYATAFPISTLLAASWNTELVKQVGRAMGSEALEYGVDILLAPGMNIQRNPLTGRNFEYYSEDPLLTGKMAAAMVSGIQLSGVGASVKHFVANNQETFRNGINVIVSERALREIYLKGFEIAIKESKPWTVMSSYNKVNGEYTSESEKLLTEILRNEWKYDGFVMTDWWAERDPIIQMKAGNDLLMPGYEEQVQIIIDAVESGRLDESILDRNVTNILKIVEKTPSFNEYAYSDAPSLKEHASLVRSAATEGMVLLENRNGVLPLNNDIKKVALLGVGAYDIVVGGHGSGYVYCSHKSSLEQGLVEAGLQPDSNLAITYASYISQQKEMLPEENFWHIPTVPELKITREELDYLANTCDIAILTICRKSGEGDDRKLEKGDYYLTDQELQMIMDTSSAFKSRGKKTVVVLNIGGVVEMTNWSHIPDAILLAWQPGQEAGYSITDILTGRENPSGKLPMTFPRRYEDVPSSTYFPFMVNDSSIVKYEEDIYVGYRHYNTHCIAPLYEFGYGLSYTEFEYSDLKFNTRNLADTIIISVNVKNVGNRAGKEVVQVYVSAPVSNIDKPTEELRKFSKTQLLQSGESEVLSFYLIAEDLASYNDKKSAWLTEPGVYQVKIGSSSRRIYLQGEIENKMNVMRKIKH